MTINLTQARKLQELGVRKYAKDEWNIVGLHSQVLPRGSYGLVTPSGREERRTYPAYNAEELIKLLRAKEHTPIDIYSHGDGFMFHHNDIDDIYGDSLTECLANELIYMIENGIVSLGEVNK